jgi:hypothetical protein
MKEENGHPLWNPLSCCNCILLAVCGSAKQDRIGRVAKGGPDSWLHHFGRKQKVKGAGDVRQAEPSEIQPYAMFRSCFTSHQRRIRRLILAIATDRLNSGPHGLSEIIYAFASTNANNGSAFAGLNGNTPWFNTTLGAAMFLGRFAYVIPVLAIAGSLVQKKKIPQSAGTFPTDGPLFVGLLIGVIIILYLLQYFPALALGPIVEHFLLLGGKSF